MVDVVSLGQSIDRDELVKVFKTPRLTKQFENVVADVVTTLPDAINQITVDVAAAQATADLALANAAIAQTSANVAQATAVAAQTTANTAIANAAAAQATANGAQTDATTALGNAAAAQTTANTAITNAATAQTAANAAQFTVNTLIARDQPLALVDAATILVDAVAHNSFSVTLGGNRTLGAPSNLADGMLLNFAIRQDGTGNRTLAYNAIYDFGAAGTPTLSTGANIVDFIFGYYDSTSGKFLASFRKGGASAGSAFSAHNNAVVQSIPTGAFTKLTFSTLPYNVGSNFATSTWTPPAGKLVKLSGAVTINGAAAAYMSVAIYKNGAEYKRGTSGNAPDASPRTSTVSCEDVANGTDTYELWAFQATGVAQNTLAATTLTWFQGSTSTL